MPQFPTSNPGLTWGSTSILGAKNRKREGKYCFTSLTVGVYVIIALRTQTDLANLDLAVLYILIDDRLTLVDFSLHLSMLLRFHY